MKKIIRLSILFFLSIVLISCQKNEIKKIGVLIYDENDTFMHEYLNEIKTKLNLKNNIKFEVLFASRSQFAQNQQFLKYYNDNYDLIIVNAVDRLASSAMIEKAEIKSIPLIFINREPQDTLSASKNSYYVGSNSLQTGKLQAELVKYMIDHNVIPDYNNDRIVQTVFLKGEQSHQDAENRTSEVINELKLLNIRYEILTIDVANWERVEAQSKAKEFFSKYEEIELIIANNDDMALGVIDYIKSENIEKRPKIIGVDGTVSGLQAIKEGLMFGTIINDYSKQVERIDILIDYLLFNVKNSTFNYDNRFQLIDGTISY